MGVPVSFQVIKLKTIKNVLEIYYFSFQLIATEKKRKQKTKVALPMKSKLDISQ